MRPAVISSSRNSTARWTFVRKSPEPIFGAVEKVQPARPLLLLAGAAVALRFVGDRGLPLTAKCGGHSAAGYALNSGGVVLDLSLMKAMRLDRDAQLIALFVMVLGANAVISYPYAKDVVMSPAGAFLAVLIVYALAAARQPWGPEVDSRPPLSGKVTRLCGRTPVRPRRQAALPARPRDRNGSGSGRPR